MKQILLILTGLLIMTSSSFAQFTYADFESVNPTGYPFGGNTYLPGVDNPDATGNNTSSKVAQTSTGHETWSGIALPVGGTIDFSPTDTVFSMDVYSSETGTVMFKVEDPSNSSVNIEIQEEYTTADTWQTIEFAFPDTASADLYGTIAVFFNFGTTDSTVWYFDNIKGPSASLHPDVDVTLNVNDSLGVADSIKVDVAGDTVKLTANNNLYTGNITLSPYRITDSVGGDYEAIVIINDTPYDTTTISVPGGKTTMTWDYMYYEGEVETLVYADFETVNPTGHVFGGSSYAPGTDNPDATGNTSSKVAMTATGQEDWAGIAMPIGGTVDFSSVSNTFTMDVYSDVSGDVIFKVENINNSEIAAEVTENYSATGTWKTMSFDFPDTLAAETFSQIVLFFNYGTSDSTIWYFDNIEGPTATFGGDVDVNLIVDDKLGVASSVTVAVDGEDVTLTEDNDVWTATQTLSPYTMPEGGGEYEAIVKVDGEPVDTTTITVTGGSATMEWNYLLLDEEPEDGTADAIGVGSTPPTIDGTIGADEVWKEADTHPLQQRDWWGAPTGLYSYFKIMWDIDNVYVLVYVDDDTPYNEASEAYMNDNVELFFDMDQSASAGFDDNDWQIRTVRGLDTWTGSSNVTDTWAEDVERAQAEFSDGSGWAVEMAIPWASLSSSFVPIATTEFNFDVVVADNADGAGGREYIIAWNTNQDINYQNTELYGTITLKGDETTGFEVAETLQNVKMYPNPAGETVNLHNLKDVNSVVVSNVLGATMKEIKVNNENMTINLGDLNTGLYFVTFHDSKGNSTSLKLLKK